MSTTTPMPPIHPGEVLAEEYLAPWGITQHRLAVDIGVPPRRINEIVHGKRRISADTALRLARYFGTSERFWLNLQGRYDIEVERDRLGPVLDEIRPLKTA
ncbi:MAG: HigA family addiction module antitoxin [Pseudonocardiaceae bacterium]